jgi:NAD(P)-dependent dehydrogenase (short-subunit alcohol dehydrogenase family)
MAGRVQGRIALVTGASSGLGKRFVEVLAAEGARVVVEERLDDLVKSIGADRAMAVVCDVTDEAAVVALYDAAEKRFGLVDTVVNNAGMTHSDNALTQSIAEFRKIMDLNVTAVWCVAREAARRLIKAGPEQSARGRIVNIASMGARHVLPNVTAYCASKAAVAHMTRSLAREWARYGLNVNALSPGYVATERRGRAEDDRQKPAAADHRGRGVGRGAAVPVLRRREVRDGLGRARGRRAEHRIADEASSLPCRARGVGCLLGSGSGVGEGLHCQRLRKGIVRMHCRESPG